MVRVLYRKIYYREVETLDGKVYKKKKYMKSGLYSYDEIKHEEEIVMDNWEDLVLDIGFGTSIENIDLKKRIWFDANYIVNNPKWGERRFYKDNFLRFRSWYEYEVVGLEEVRMRNIVNDLTVQEFINLMKDNGISNINTLK